MLLSSMAEFDFSGTKPGDPGLFYPRVPTLYFPLTPPSCVSDCIRTRGIRSALAIDILWLLIKAVKKIKATIYRRSVVVNGSSSRSAYLAGTKLPAKNKLVTSG